MTPRVRDAIRLAKWQKRVYAKIDMLKDGCWMWRGAAYKDKYGFYQYAITQQANERQPVHRVLWKWIKGELPEGGMLVNQCGNTLCVNPEHWVWCEHWTRLRDAG